MLLKDQFYTFKNIYYFNIVRMSTEMSAKVPPSSKNDETKIDDAKKQIGKDILTLDGCDFVIIDSLDSGDVDSSFKNQGSAQHRRENTLDNVSQANKEYYHGLFCLDTTPIYAPTQRLERENRRRQTIQFTVFSSSLYFFF